jgi:hypothetical protein
MLGIYTYLHVINLSKFHYLHFFTDVEKMVIYLIDILKD